MCFWIGVSLFVDIIFGESLRIWRVICVALLDKSDLNLKISKENFLEAEPIISDEFPFAYGGAKATYGVSTGKVCFEVKFIKAMDVRADFGDLESKHILRVGWSDLLTGLQLGKFKKYTV